MNTNTTQKHRFGRRTYCISGDDQIHSIALCLVCPNEICDPDQEGAYYEADYYDEDEDCIGTRTFSYYPDIEDMINSF